MLRQWRLNPKEIEGHEKSHLHLSWAGKNGHEPLYLSVEQFKHNSTNFRTFQRIDFKLGKASGLAWQNCCLVKTLLKAAIEYKTLYEKFGLRAKWDRGSFLHFQSAKVGIFYFITDASPVSWPFPVIKVCWVTYCTHLILMTGNGQLTRGAFVMK
jgi:hypothetical protein